VTKYASNAIVFTNLSLRVVLMNLPSRSENGEVILNVRRNLGKTVGRGPNTQNPVPGILSVTAMLRQRSL